MYTRNCPQCLKEISNTSFNYCKRAKQLRTLCRKCSISNRDFTGHKNPFYGKKHSDKILEQIKNTKANSGYKDSIETRKKKSIGSAGKNNPMYGKTIYGVWIDKYGVRAAYQKIKEHKLKQSINTSGSNNPMYGKPAPKKSGNGISGWYKTVFFRSLKELSYIINYLEQNNLKWTTCESVGIKINYKNYSGYDRTYTPDFIIDNKIIEIKPKRLINSPLVKLKTEAAKKYCLEHGYEYEIIDWPLMEIKTIINLEQNNVLKFTEYSKIRFYKQLQIENGEIINA